MQWSADRALEHWEREGLLTGKQVRELRDSLEQEDKHLPSRALSIFGTIGAILVGLGVILFFASNWQDMTQFLKIGVLLAGVLLTGILGYWLGFESGKYPKIGASLLLLNALLFGSSIFLVAQIFHLQLNYWFGTLLWLLGTVYFAIVLRSRLHVWLAVPLLLFTIGWLRTAHITGFANELDFLFDDKSSSFGLLPVIGVALVAGSVILQRFVRTAFGSSIIFAWGLVLVLLPIVISTVDEELLYGFFSFPTDVVGVAVVLAAVAIAVWSLFRGEFQSDKSKHGLIALLIYMVYLFVLARIPVWMGFTDFSARSFGYYEAFEAQFWRGWTLSALFVVHIILTFILHLVVLWFGTLLRRPVVVNVGMLGMVLLIMIQYFSFGFEMMDRSLFFIFGGLILLGLSAGLERKRRQLLASFS